MEEKLLRSQLGIELGNSVTVAKLCKSFLESNRAVHSAATASDYRYTVNAHIIPILGMLRTDEVTQVHLNDFIQTMSGKMGKATVNKTIRYLRSILRWGKRNGNLITDLEFRFLRCAESKKRYLELNEIEEVLKHAGDYRLLILTAIHTGMRSGEIFNLHWEDIDFSERIIHIINRDDFHTKSYKIRIVPMTETLTEELSHVSGGSQKGLVFPKPDGTRRVNIRGAIEGIVRKSGVKFTLHDLRRTFASHVSFNGRDLGGVQKLLGHSSINTTMGYVNHSIDRLRGLVSSIDSIGAKHDEEVQ